MLVRFLQPEPKEERDIVLSVFLRYLRLCWKLQDVYRLEPAGSHGVWGLDDYCFLPYIFGSGQLRGNFPHNKPVVVWRSFFMITTDQTEISVSAAVHPPLPSTNLYFMAIMRILDVKTGPFHEHSSQLHSIALGVPNWSKVNSGLFKMYQVRTLLDYISHIYLTHRSMRQAEVLGKRVVVQHIPLGGLLEWEHKEVVRPGIGHRVTVPYTSTPHPGSQDVKSVSIV